MLSASLPALMAPSSCLVASLPVATQVAPSPAEIRQIARDAYVYGFPMVDNYRIQCASFARIRIAPDHPPFDVSKLTPQTRAALEAGMADAWADLAALKARIY